MSAHWVAVLCVAVASLAGCVHAPGLDVRYPDGAANRALLASVATRRVQIEPVADARVDASSIGVVKDGAPFVTARPVGEVVREALTTELAANGHAVVGDRADVVLATVVEEFWLDVVRGRSTTQYVGKVAMVVTVLDGRTGNGLVSRRYIGTKREQVERASDDAARETMNAALSRSMHDLAMDSTLVAAFARATAAATSR